jgi:hypothetical protein
MNSQIHCLATGFSKDFSNLGLAYGFLSQNPRVHFAVHKGWTKVFNFRFGGFFHPDMKLTGRSGFYQDFWLF